MELTVPMHEGCLRSLHYCLSHCSLLLQPNAAATTDLRPQSTKITPHPGAGQLHLTLCVSCKTSAHAGNAPNWSINRCIQLQVWTTYVGIPPQKPWPLLKQACKAVGGSRSTPGPYLQLGTLTTSQHPALPGWRTTMEQHAPYSRMLPIGKNTGFCRWN